jgi:hypothetical protein
MRLFGRLRGVMVDQCCGDDVGSLLFQINVICLLLAAIGAMAIMKYPAWFGGVTAVTQSIVGR